MTTFADSDLLDLLPGETSRLLVNCGDSLNSKAKCRNKDLASLRFEDLFDIAEIQKLQDSFAEATGVASLITNSVGVPITAPSRFCRLCRDIIRKTTKGVMNCYCSDAVIGRRNPLGPIIQPCLSGGLWDAGANISVGGKHLANWLIGQVRNEALDEQKILRYAREIGADPDQFKHALEEVPIMTQEKFEKVARMLFLFANELSTQAFQNLQKENYIFQLCCAEKARSELERRLLSSEKFQSLGLLAEGVAHDFNNLLLAIIGNIDLALEKMPPNHDVANHLSMAVKASERAAELCNQMLKYSGRGQYVFRGIDINDLVGELAQLLEASVGAKANIIISCMGDLPEIEGDPSQLRQVVTSLISNAAEAITGPDGKIMLKTGLEELSCAQLVRMFGGENLSSGRYVYLEVGDNGLGMDKDTLERVFDPFFTTKFTGRGLGLASVLGIVRSHKGAIEVSSSPGQGTFFRVFFPIKTPEVFELTQAITVENQKWQGSGKVLLVEDEELVRRVVSKMLNRLGCSVILARGTKEVVELFQKHQDEIRLVLLNLTEHKSEELKTLATLRKMKKDVIVFLSSGKSEASIQHGVYEEWCNCFIQKPYTLRKLSEKMASFGLLGQSR